MFIFFHLLNLFDEAKVIFFTFEGTPSEVEGGGSRVIKNCVAESILYISEKHGIELFNRLIKKSDRIYLDFLTKLTK
ncbi:hypothetical protein A3B40_02020 [Candidatus Roizmanbacteria bacterium RIFCSPLOWO2_01_FULL_37_16]|uniref:Uncharacterized protein n=1 Tax=Candidatus Roizmanbacteria bacterium RIFCSPLOWO2_01_FULL_37_16 TaxID=1802058 RepID=A0A1F7IP51_9BACT|nr:MAG: hypothetical protein A2859_00735 [Candidatus Roizmanbacteria bacterium RIFCSPHIGHO2_01_FULL_37_16b]OGK45163.1 MAG: hypothetical protein A3B40_02020 [Candidatus Roizmanbacteria bacterium RIFCSPLOWO2_01_FULL_37_16]